ncbi:cation:proton antiporter [Legionella oakridgensis]|uniref:Kef-type K+ transport system, predicted NAD-binding component n=2 Tax=Legionella oakridgensis TaxID=29423 RepID=W0B8S0_9GAMM|nr:cation:proton antiporter [Legionella oakridgensis]AHE66933.1 Kef-type K+ transport system, predicted NAD-binding component [Legionella oakridgensis ATCC 33761 = DSM 21215]ETO93388.1 transporter, CPA2 family [Legionella oakridgensis RV-2-2007]KTD39501.1 putative sodium/hydrogen exchanger family protein [Legionella oakridgensis]STY20039.1 putative sodium/hydrogen exchanger family protein [Legionella longbeachae]
MTFLHTSPFYELAALLLFAIAAGWVSLFLRQPMVVSFIVVGILVGPGFLGIVQSYGSIELLAELGITVLLFLVGLKLDIQLIRTLGLVVLATGIGQVVFTAIIGFFIALALKLNVINALYVSVALTFSSTIIIVKMLSDKREADSLHGRIAIGVLIVQDIFVVLTMIILSAFDLNIHDGTLGQVMADIVMMFLSAMVVLFFLGLFIRCIANPLVRSVAHSPELLIIFSIGWAACLASLGSVLGLSKELGGLLAGISLASTPFRDAIASRLSSVRDFLLLFFFITIGSQLHFNQLGEQIVPAAIFSLFVLIGDPLIMLVIMGIMGYRKRTSFFVGLTVAQISEFSFIFMAMGLKLGHINAESLGLVTLVGLITITVSVYMITYSQSLYQWFDPVLSIFERKLPHREESNNVRQQLLDKCYEIVLFGLGRYGQAIAEHLLQNNLKVLAIDFNPDEVKKWLKRGQHAMYGDACDIEFIRSLPLTGVKWVICAIPQHAPGLTHHDPRVMLINGLKTHHYQGKIAVSTQHANQVEALKVQGVDMVFLPFLDAASRAVEKIVAAI